MKAKMTAAVLSVLVFSLCSYSFAAETSGRTAKKKDATAKIIPDPNLCSDPAVSMVLTKTVKADSIVIGLAGKICNNGLADYSGKDPLDAHFMVYTWHPPMTAAQEHDLKTISHAKTGKKLNKGECKQFTQNYKISGVSTLGHKPETQTERPASKQFVFRVEKKYPMKAGDKDFSGTEDCDISNNAAAQTVDYMEKK
jgi:hypothetical protein